MVIPTFCCYFVAKMKVMEQHICLISLGSNTDRERNINLAQRQLALYFPGIRLGTEMDTIPVGLSNPAHFTNQLAMMYTSLSIEEVKQILKKIEIQAGRLKEDKKNEVIKLDIDLLMYDSQILKSSDLKREFINAGLKEFDL